MHIYQKKYGTFYTFPKRYNPNKQEKKPFIISFQMIHLWSNIPVSINSTKCQRPRYPGRPTDSQVNFSSKHRHLNRKELHIALEEVISWAGDEVNLMGKRGWNQVILWLSCVSYLIVGGKKRFICLGDILGGQHFWLEYSPKVCWCLKICCFFP